jgi:hypothetical protein
VPDDEQRSSAPQAQAAPQFCQTKWQGLAGGRKKKAFARITKTVSRSYSASYFVSWRGGGRACANTRANMPGQTGPKSRRGKAVSSQNARKHGMRSKKLIVEDETQEAFDSLAAGWRAEYDDDGQATKSLLERVILNDWFLRRAERRYMGAEEELAQKNTLEWTEEDHKKIELYLRYKTTNERSFYRAFNSLRGLRKDKIREALDLEKMEKQAEEFVRKAFDKVGAERQAKAEAKKAENVMAGRGKDLFQGQNHPKKQRKIGVLDQWVEVEVGYNSQR